jgi:hypothetical protein
MIFTSVTGLLEVIPSFQETIRIIPLPDSIWQGRALQAKGDLDGALQYAQRALTIDEKVYGPSHPTDVNNIGQILQAKAIWTALCVTPKGLNNL